MNLIFGLLTFQVRFFMKFNHNGILASKWWFERSFTITTVLAAKSDSDDMFCLQLLSKTLTCTLH